ncbi:ATP synthase F1 subunit gamma [Candidatus Kaiserbacteria bacterium]|nr:ATP synthase F1 subunit gamma [Candidatus Kaiserbacteria bacterium]MCB9811865.1 ATP synthase F1 subunit gamma [Candidatus Nomurabacteria bacterium]
MALKQIKNKIVSTQKTAKVTKAMEAVSAVKMRKSQERAFESRAYVHAAMRVLSNISQSQEGLHHPLAEKRDNPKRLLVIVTSDKGLAGSVNSAVLKRAEQYFFDHSEVDVIAIGRKALEFAERSGRTVLENHINVSDDITFEDVVSMAKTILTSFSAGEYGAVEVMYQNFLSTFEQEPTSRTILPLDPAEVHYIMRGIKPKTGKFSDVAAPTDNKIAYTVEGGEEGVLNALIPLLVEVILYHALLESKASEHSARMVAMKNATDKAKEVTKLLTLKFNNARQAAITAEVSEITSGIEAMK